MPPTTDHCAMRCARPSKPVSCGRTPRSATSARILRSTFLSCGPMTQDSGRFADVEQLLNSLTRTIVAAWGR